MLEVLVSLAVIAISMLGAANLQLNSLKMSKSAANRTQAIFLATEIGERIEANKTGAIAGAYVSSSTTAAPPSVGSDCKAVSCNPVQLAAYDIAQWNTRIGNTLKSATWDITNTIAAPSTYNIVIRWRDRRDRTIYGSAGELDDLQYVATRVIQP